MKLYLSSYRVGRQFEKLVELVPNNKVAFIPNAVDCFEYNSNNRVELIKSITDLGIEVEIVDLKNYFGKEKELESKLLEIGATWIIDGNTFVLRQAMRLSGFEHIVKRLPDSFLYAGYSAGICVLAPDLRGLQQVDDSTKLPYEQISKPIFEGLGILDYLILPHYKSDHPESADIDKEVAFCKAHNIKYKTLRDGEVLIIEK